MDATEKYRLALVAEREAWAAVQDKLPGSPGFSQALWDRWMAAVTAADAAREQLTSAPGDLA